MWSEEEEKRRKEALKTLLDYSMADTFHDADSSFRASESELIFGNNSFVSFDRGTKYNYDEEISIRNQSTPIANSNNKWDSFTDFQTQENVNVPDSEFFDSETGKQLIYDNEVSHQRLFIQDADCTGCSKWKPISRRNMSSLSLDSPFEQKPSVSVGEFMGAFSETVTFYDSQKKNPFLNFLSSTRAELRKSMSLSSLPVMDISKITSLDTRRDESSSMAVTPTSFLSSTPKLTKKDSDSKYVFRYYLSSAARRNILRLRNEERSAGHMHTSYSLETDKTVTARSNSCSGATGSESSTYALTSGSQTSVVSSSNSCYEQWFLEPESIILNQNKGNRVRLVNNSGKSLKFKAVFDSRTTNVCPLSGTVSAMDEIGLRIMLSQYAKKHNENFATDVKIIIGKHEKIIHVKYFKEEKSIRSRKRTYILY